MTTPTQILTKTFALAAAAALCSGCQNQMAFGTETKFGLDISQRPDQQVDITMGYRRSEMVSIPINSAEKTKDPRNDCAEGGGFTADDKHDAYSVLGRFSVTYDYPLKPGASGLHLHQVFATGMAARKAAADPNMQEAFGKAAGAVQAKANEGGH